jgi:ATP-dependent Lon protease
LTGDFPREALAALPLFPLPRVALFPGCVLPLHVFEPRYRAMLADAVRSHGCIAMVGIASTSGAADPPLLARVAGLGVVLEVEPLPDGRSNIVLQGRARVALDELPFEPPYRRARASVLEPRDTPVSEVSRAALHAAATAFVGLVKGADFAAMLGHHATDGAAELADLCAQYLLLDADARQRALEELDVAARVRLVTAELVAQRAAAASASGTPRGSAN